MDKEYETGYIVGENKGLSDGKLLLEPFPHINSTSTNYVNGYKIGYLKGYIISAKEKEKDIDRRSKLGRLIDQRLKTINNIVLQKDKPKTFRKK